jgi:hypothetical protein
VTRAKKGTVVHHKDRNRLNNTPENLQVLPSQSEHGALHCEEERQIHGRVIRRGRVPRGAECYQSRLTAEQVVEIRRTRDSITCVEWARRLGVSRAAVEHARRGLKWRSLPL